MRLKYVKLEGYRSHESTEIKLATYTYIWGPYGSGKSSFLDAIATALIGRNRHVDGSGRGLRNDIRIGSDRYEVSLVLANGGGEIPIHRLVSRSLHSLTFPGDTGDAKRGQERLIGMLGVTDDLIETVLDPTLFSERKAEDQKSTLRKLLSRGRIDVPKAAAAAGISEISGVDSLSKIIKSQKDSTIRDLNRDIGHLEEELPADPGPVPDIEKLRRRREEINTKLEAAISLEATYMQGIESMEERNKECRLEASKLCHGNAPAAVSEAEEKLAEQRAAFEEASQEIGKTKSKLDDINRQGIAVTAMGSKCGVVDVFTCPLSDDEKKKMAKTLRGSFREAEKKVATLEQAVEGLKKRYEDGRKALDAAKTHEAESVQKKRFEDEVSRNQGRIEELRKKLVAARKEIPSLREALSPLDIELEASRSAAGAKKQRDDVLAKIYSKRRQQEIHSAAVEALISLRENLLSQGQEGLMKEINSFLKNAGMGEMLIIADPFEIRVDGVLLGHLSSGQKIIADAAIRCAAAKVSGFGIVAVDDSNKLGERSSQELSKALYASGVQAIICKTTDFKPPEEVTAKMDGRVVTAYWATNPSISGPSSFECLAGGGK